LVLVFEHCDQDLKKYFDSLNGEIDPNVVKSFMYENTIIFYKINAIKANFIILGTNYYVD
jgi:hypothetical protein